MRNVVLTVVFAAAAAFTVLCGTTTSSSLPSNGQKDKASSSSSVVKRTSAVEDVVYMSDIGPLIEAAMSNITKKTEMVSPYAFPNDWYLMFSEIGYEKTAQGYLVPNLDFYSLYSTTAGFVHTYEVKAEMEARSIEDSADPMPVEFSVYDPVGACTFENNILTPTGTAGTVVVTGTDTNGESKTAPITMTPLGADKVIDYYHQEGTTTERYIWSTNIFSRLNAVSMASEDMVTIYGCRTTNNWSAQVNVFTPWTYPRSLGRFGTGGRMIASEWPGVTDFATKRRTHCTVENADFFWPELLTNLWCYSINCHEALWSEADGMSAIAVSEHYLLGTDHVDWLWSRNRDYSPKFRYGHGEGEFVHCTYASMRKVGYVKTPSGGNTDISVWYTSVSIPPQCRAKFITKDVANRLSLSNFYHIPGFTITCHQTVNPVCMSFGYFNGAWHPTPGVGEAKNWYIFPSDNAQLQKCQLLEHMTHMYDSSDPFFFVSPKGQVIPSGAVHYGSSAQNGGSGPSYLDYYGEISTMIRNDSSGTEDLQFWTYEELWCGGVNTLEN